MVLDQRTWESIDALVERLPFEEGTPLSPLETLLIVYSDTLLHGGRVLITENSKPSLMLQFNPDHMCIIGEPIQ